MIKEGENKKKRAARYGKGAKLKISGRRKAKVTSCYKKYYDQYGSMFQKTNAEQIQ